MAYQSFQNSKQKIQKTWEQNETNTSEIDNNLSKFQVKFDSIQFNKKITTIKLIDNEIFASNADIPTLSVELNNFPEFIINHINILPIVELVGDANDDTIFRIFSSESIGIVKVGDLAFDNFTTSTMYKLSGNNYLLKIDPGFTVRTIVAVNEPPQTPFESEETPFRLNLSLKIMNPQIYEKTNIHKT